MTRIFAQITTSLSIFPLFDITRYTTHGKVILLRRKCEHFSPFSLPIEENLYLKRTTGLIFIHVQEVQENLHRFFNVPCIFQC
ncbi:MAG: hypothetical protein AYK18_13315 [Theionarchaea archaeon DG-70]|nr:MAG: hypothetical protein AYK18_13315 [Theionarchaea archaeon DG-70]